jgi:MscS family membrane protein
MVHMTAFNASSIDINLYYFTITTNWVEWREIVEEHMLAYMAIIEEAGAAIAFPTQSIHIEGMPEGLPPAPAIQPSGK